MLSVQLHLTIPGVTASNVCTTLTHGAGDGQGPCSFMMSGHGGPTTAQPSVPARSGAQRHQGTLQWSGERGAPSTSDHAAISLLDGSWSCVDDGPGAAVTFVAHLDVASATTGQPPELAAQAFIDDALVAMSSVFAGEVRVDDAVIQAQHQRDLRRRLLAG